MGIDEILDLLDVASDEDLLLSRKNCHIRGLHSIVLYSDKFNRLLRLYLTTPNHQMHNNLRDDLNINLGVHTHRYDLQLTKVHGKAVNVRYRIVDRKQDTSSQRVDVYKFFDKDNFIKQDRVFLRRKDLKLIDNTFMDKDELHTVYVPAGKTASWLVQEGFEVKDHTLLYTNKSVECESYENFKSAEEVKKFVIDYYNEVCNGGLNDRYKQS
jgi:hypothetical protein